MELSDLKDWFGLSKEAIELMKAAYSVLPKGKEREEAEKKVEAAAALLARSDAKLARDLGYKMCQCTFPPQIMLWKEAQSAWMCPNAECGSAKKSAQISSSRETPSWSRLTEARRGYGRKDNR